MKPKGINIFEQHVEKLVIGVAAIIVVGIAAKAFFTEPNAVTLDGRSLAPTEVDEVLANKAKSLKAKVDSPTSLEVGSVGRLTEWFEKQHENPDIPEAPPVALVAPVTYELGSENAGFASSSTEMYAEVAAPAPKNLQVTSLNYTIDPEELERVPALESRWPDGPPYDMHAVHVSAEFNGKALRTALAGFVEDRKPIPSQWVDQDMAILDIIAEREQLLPDGSWSSPERVGLVPGQQSVRDRYTGALAREKNELLQEVSSLGEAVYKPGFFNLADGTSWSYDIVKRAAPKTPEYLDAERRMLAAWNNVERTQEQLDRYLKQLAERQQRQSSPLDSEAGGTGKSGGFGEGSQVNPTEDRKDERPKETPEQRRERTMREAITKAREAYDAAKEALLAIDPDVTEFPDTQAQPQTSREALPPVKGPQPYSPPDAMPFGEGGGTSFGTEGGGEHGKTSGSPPAGKGGLQPGVVKSLFENESLRVWTHDVNATPGATYRYRLAVALYNPFFGRESRLAESQQELAESAIVLSHWTDWSEPVRVSPPQQFFAVTGIYNDQIDDRSASFEVYAFTRGEHRVMTVTARPGEPIGEKRMVQPTEPGGEPVEVDFFTGATMLDVIQIDGGSALNQRVHILVAMPDGSIEVIDPANPKREEERQRLRSMATRS